VALTVADLGYPPDTVYHGTDRYDPLIDHISVASGAVSEGKPQRHPISRGIAVWS